MHGETEFTWRRQSRRRHSALGWLPFVAGLVVAALYLHFPAVEKVSPTVELSNPSLPKIVASPNVQAPTPHQVEMLNPGSASSAQHAQRAPSTRVGYAELRKRLLARDH